jgi:hypothetical protein
MSKIYVVKAESIYARTGPQSWCIGNLFHGDHFEIEGGSDTYAWGRAFGKGFQGHCWISKKALSPHPPTKQTSHGKRFHIYNIAAAHTATLGKLESGETHPHLTIHIRVTAERSSLYGNYWHNFPYQFPFTAPFGVRSLHGLLPCTTDALPRGYPLGWRYTTKDTLAAMVLDYKHNPPRWGFISRADIETPQQDKYFNAFATNPENRNKHNPYHREPAIIHPTLA